METLQHPITVFWLCVLMHLIADYNLQGILSDLKQSSWWNEQLSKAQIRNIDKYAFDFIAGPGCHALMWSIMTCLPLLLVVSPVVFSICVLANTVVHGVVDHMKANMYLINLCQDQVLHLIQIAVTVVILETI